MQVCTSLQADNHASTPPLSFFTGWMPFLPPNQQLCRAFNCRILYGRYLPTVTFIIAGIPSSLHSFIPGLKPSFSANLSHRSYSFSFSGLTTSVSLKHDGPTGQTTGQRGSDPSALLQAN